MTAAAVERGSSRAWWVYLVVSGLGIVAHRLVPDGVPRDVVYQAFGVGAVIAILVGVRRHRPLRRRPWFLMAAGQLLWSSADAILTVRDDVLGIGTSPSSADAVYLLGYPCVAIGLFLLIRDRRPRRDVAGLLDAAIVSVSLGLLIWVVLQHPVLATFGESVPAGLVALAYPAGDIVLASLLIRLVTTPGARTVSYALLVAAVWLLIGADTASSALYPVLGEQTEPLEVGWLASYALWAAAALHPSMASLSEPTSQADVPFSAKRLVALCVAVLVAPGLLAVQALAGATTDIWTSVVGSVLMSLLVVSRIYVSFRQLEAAHRERERARAELAHQATHDGLTGLPNRAQALLMIAGALNRARRSGEVVGLLFVDLDGFKQVNDTLGHQAGDEVLQHTAARMVAGVRAGDAVARLGGDEFVVLLEPLIDEPAAVVVADRLVVGIAEPVRLSTGREARVGASIGVAVNADSGTDPERLLLEADHAVYRAKAAGRGRVEVFAPSLRADLERRSVLEAAVGAAVGRNTVMVGHTPIVGLRHGRTVGHQVEVYLPGPDGVDLSRWDFLLEADGTQVVCDLDAWVLRNGRWQGEEAVGGFTAIPVTARHLAQRRILDDVAAIVAGGVDPSALMLVVPADQIFGDLRVLAHLDQLRRSGVLLCADGFGGSSGTTDRWAQLPFDHVRLDARLLAPTTGSLLLRLTVETAHAFGYGVLVSGVADPEQLALLTSIGCDLAEGPALDAPTDAPLDTAAVIGPEADPLR